MWRDVRAVRWAGVVAVAVVPATAVFLGFSAIQDKPSAAIPEPMETVDVAALDPVYKGRTVTWDRVDQLQAAGKANIVWLYGDDTDNYALVFESEGQLNRWICHHDSESPDCQGGS